MRKKLVVLDLAERYLEDVTYERGFISNEWVLKVSRTLNLKKLSDEELADMWDLVEMTLEQEISHAMINADGIRSDLEWRNREKHPLLNKTLEETNIQLKNELDLYRKVERDYMDIKSAFLEVINNEARSRRAIL